MGLDMYLAKRTYVKNWKFFKDEERYTISVSRPNGTTIQPKRITYVEEELGYWRKANAIHAWFVTNCQGGEDDCRNAHVPREKLVDLLRIVDEVLASVSVSTDASEAIDPSKAQELLPTQAGFFFGTTEYDEWYIENLRSTKAIVESALEESTDGELFYHSSW